MADMKEVILKYRAIRDQKDDIKEKHKEELKPFNAALEQMENWFLKQLALQQVDSFKCTGSGTAYKSIITSHKVEDWDVFWEYAHDNGLAKNMIDKRVSKAAVEEYIEEYGVNPPGISTSKIIKVNVRK